MKIDFIPLTIEHVKTIELWRYDGFEKSIFIKPYFESHLKTGELVGPGGCIGFAAIRDEELVGLFEYYSPDAIMNIGLALKPELTGKGLGCNYVLQGIEFGIRHFQYKNNLVELSVHKLNMAAIQVYRKAGFVEKENAGDEIRMSKAIVPHK